MNPRDFLKPDQVDEFLRLTVRDGLCGTLSYLKNGSWRVWDIVARSVSESTFRVQVVSANLTELVIQKDLPVGLCIQHEHSKFIFETTVIEAPGDECPWDIGLEMPDKIEKLPRRAYEREPIPAGMTVRAFFWHRGHKNNSEQPPKEDYWQGTLYNLSAGGAMIRVEQEQRDFFSLGQLVGVQFTPMSYQKPLLLEGHVRHLQALNSENALLVGVEFLGLEASPEGREILHRLLEVVDAYEQLNLPPQNRSQNSKH
ncbi:MAG: PilZ domain-containing protein [Phycisphaerae bacterium]|nr:PilZ domain-containing protein [Phycisphaerae bacterium]